VAETEWGRRVVCRSGCSQRERPGSPDHAQWRRNRHRRPDHRRIWRTPRTKSGADRQASPNCRASRGSFHGHPPILFLKVNSPARSAPVLSGPTRAMHDIAPDGIRGNPQLPGLSTACTRGSFERLTIRRLSPIGGCLPGSLRKTGGHD